MTLQVVVERPPIFTAFRFTGSQADVDELNTYLSGTAYSATFVSSTQCQLTGPQGTRNFPGNAIVVFGKWTNGDCRPVAKFATIAAALQFYQ